MDNPASTKYSPNFNFVKSQSKSAIPDYSIKDKHSEKVLSDLKQQLKQNASDLES